MKPSTLVPKRKSQTVDVVVSEADIFGKSRYTDPDQFAHHIGTIANSDAKLKILLIRNASVVYRLMRNESLEAPRPALILFGLQMGHGYLDRIKPFLPPYSEGFEMHENFRVVMESEVEHLSEYPRELAAVTKYFKEECADELRLAALNECAQELSQQMGYFGLGESSIDLSIAVKMNPDASDFYTRQLKPYYVRPLNELLSMLQHIFSNKDEKTLARVILKILKTISLTPNHEEMPFFKILEAYELALLKQFASRSMLMSFTCTQRKSETSFAIANQQHSHLETSFNDYLLQQKLPYKPSLTDFLLLSPGNNTLIEPLRKKVEVFYKDKKPVTKVADSIWVFSVHNQTKNCGFALEGLVNFATSVHTKADAKQDFYICSHQEYNLAATVHAAADYAAVAWRLTQDWLSFARTYLGDRQLFSREIRRSEHYPTAQAKLKTALDSEKVQTLYDKQGSGFVIRTLSNMFLQLPPKPVAALLEEIELTQISDQMVSHLHTVCFEVDANPAREKKLDRVTFAQALYHKINQSLTLDNYNNFIFGVVQLRVFLQQKCPTGTTAGLYQKLIELTFTKLAELLIKNPLLSKQIFTDMSICGRQFLLTEAEELITYIDSRNNPNSPVALHYVGDMSMISAAIPQGILTTRQIEVRGASSHKRQDSYSTQSSSDTDTESANVSAEDATSRVNSSSSSLSVSPTSPKVGPPQAAQKSSSPKKTPNKESTDFGDDFMDAFVSRALNGDERAFSLEGVQRARTIYKHARYIEKEDHCKTLAPKSLGIEFAPPKAHSTSLPDEISDDSQEDTESFPPHKLQDAPTPLQQFSMLSAQKSRVDPYQKDLHAHGGSPESPAPTLGLKKTPPDSDAE